jgi:hypothetical protein
MGDSSQSLETIRRRIEHEDNLVNQRVSWIVGSQAFLLTGYAILLNGAAQTAQARGDEQVAHDQALLIKLIPFTSICVTALLWFGILAGIWAIRDLRAWVKTLPGFDASQVQARSVTRIIGLTMPALVPFVFPITWLLLILS